jgi:MFS family permease
MMANIYKPPCDEGVILSAPHSRRSTGDAGTWILAATILGSSMAFIDGSVVNVALPVLQKAFNATSADVQWVVEAYSLFLASLILVGGSLGDSLNARLSSLHLPANILSAIDVQRSKLAGITLPGAISSQIQAAAEQATTAKDAPKNAQV